jgi:hypothetical protein
METEEEAVCPACGSANGTIEWYWGPTGVVAPDGGREYQLQTGYRCLECSAIEEM